MVRQRGQHHGDLRAALISAALDLLNEVDAPKLTLRAVARRAGVSPAAPYHHFQDKAALLDAAALEGFLHLGVVQAGVLDPSPRRRIAELTRAYVQFALEHPAHYAVMLASLHPREETGGLPGRLTDLDLAARATFDNLTATVGAARPDLQPNEVRNRALQVWAQASGTVSVAEVAIGLDDAFSIDAVLGGAAAAACSVVDA